LSINGGTSTSSALLTTLASFGTSNVFAQGPLIKSGGQRRPFAVTMPNGVSIPSDFPRINITTSTTNADPDPIFIDNRGGGGRPYNVIFDNSGSPIWYSREPDERRDMKVQHNGVMTMLARDGGNHFNGFNTTTNRSQPTGR